MIQIDKGFFDEMLAHGLASFPNEACGLLAGKEGRPVKFFPMTNFDASPATYRLEPREQLRVFEEMDAEGWELLGIFHTHTHSEAAPSDTDRKQAFYPEAVHLVMSLSDRSRPVLRAFRIDEERVTEEHLVIA
jgi:proteasome lid subunit RPN8/RPN11